MLPEINRRTQEELQYWGGFFGEALRPDITRNVHSPRPTARNPITRTYYKPVIHVFDRRRERLEEIQREFGGVVREQPQVSVAPNRSFLSTIREPGFFWEIGSTNSALLFLEQLQPYFISQNEFIGVMIDFLSQKNDRILSSGSTQASDEEAQEREELEGELYRQFRDVRALSPFPITAPLTAANVAGIIDACAHIGILRSADSPLPEYSMRAGIHTANTNILEAISNEYGGSINRIRHGTPVEYSESRSVLDIRGHQSRRILEETFPHLRFIRRQAELALAFLNFQNNITGGSEVAGRHRRGELARILHEHSTPTVDLVSLLREGFYSEMYRLNHQ